MLPKYKNDEYYQGFIGRCFRRNTRKTEYSVTKILGFNTITKMFVVEDCFFSFGDSMIEQNEKYYCFVNADNFKEISINDYSIIYSLCKNKTDKITLL